MKKIITYALGLVAAAGLVAVLSSHVGTTVQGADVLRAGNVPGQPWCAVNSSNGIWVATVAGGAPATRGTNGLYPFAIAHDTNLVGLVQLTGPGNNGNSLAIQFSAQGGDSTNAVLVLYASSYPPTPVMGIGGTLNCPSAGLYTNNSPWQIFDTINLALSATAITTTNKVYTSSTTPAKGALPYIYIYSIGSGVGAASSVSNYQVWACSY